MYTFCIPLQQNFVVLTEMIDFFCLSLLYSENFHILKLAGNMIEIMKLCISVNISHHKQKLIRYQWDNILVFCITCFTHAVHYVCL